MELTKVTVMSNELTVTIGFDVKFRSFIYIYIYLLRGKAMNK